MRAGALLLAIVGLGGCAADREPESKANLSSKAAAVMRSSFVARGIAGMDRLDQDEVQKICTEFAEKPLPPELAEKINASQLKTVRKPESGKLMGDWKAGEKLAQEGRGLQFSEKADGPRGGNCYACHQITPEEISYGNLGPSLARYGALRGSDPAVVEYTYAKIYNAQSFSACSNMPRFGYRQILTPEQIADLVALLLDPQSPVNKQ